MRHGEIKQIIIDHILHDNLEVGDKIMSIPELSRKLKTSDKTIQKAIKVLKEDNVLYSIKGKGNYIKTLGKVNDSSNLKVAVFDSDTENILQYFNGKNSHYDGHLKIKYKKFPESSIKGIINVYKPEFPKRCNY